MGCAEETGETETTTQIVKTLDDLPTCSQGKFAVVYYVESEEAFYVCGYSTENPNQYGYHVINPPDDTCTVEDNGDGTKTVRCTDGTDVTFVTVNDVECVHDIGVCEDGDACTDHGCDAALGCYSSPTECDDGDACTVNACESATGCDYSEPTVCDDGNACTADVCVSPTGCEFEPNVNCPAGSECNPDNGECVLLPVCPCFTESDMNMYANYFRPGYSLSYYSCVEWEAGYSDYAPRLYLRSSMYNSRVYVGYAFNSLTGERERWCSGSLYRYPNSNWSTISNFENDAGPGYGLLRPEDWEKCWQNIQDKIDLIGVQCTVYAPEECATGLVWCSGACIDPQTSQAFCGASGDCSGPNAGVACGDGEFCLEGTCNTGTLYSSLFTHDVAPTPEQCSDWQTFTDGLTGAYTGVRISGSQNEVGYTCTDPAAVAQIAEGLQTGTGFIVTCGENDWQLCPRYGDEFWVNGGSYCSPSNCSVTDYKGAILRPCGGATWWGGVDPGNTCFEPTQTITVVFF